ncbi:TRAP transporter small permease [Hoeflea sp.]|uniref:TRAP transporter small permease n=1 Tax=Hoeflea sp. TaxID=1940281 RepID=UPI003B0192B5
MLRSITDFLTDKLMILSAIVAALMMFHVCADVFSKLILRQPIIGTLETVSLFYMVAVVFLPLAAVQREQGNVFVELFTQGLGKKAQIFLDGFAQLLTFGLSLLLFWKGLETAIAKTAVGELSTNIEFQVQVWPARWFPVVGFAIVALWSALQFVESMLFVFLDRAPTGTGQFKHEDEGGF